MTWTNPTRKWRDRARRLVASEAPPNATLREYAIRALPCLAYTSQLLGPHADIPQQEQRLVAQTVKFPYCACPRQAPHSGRTLHQPQIPLAREYCLAHLLRTAAHHRDIALTAHTALTQARERHLTIAYAADPLKPEPGWDGTAYGTQLALAHLRADLPPETRAIMHSSDTVKELQRRILHTLVQDRYPEPTPTRWHDEYSCCSANWAPRLFHHLTRSRR